MNFLYPEKPTSTLPQLAFQDFKKYWVITKKRRFFPNKEEEESDREFMERINLFLEWNCKRIISVETIFNQSKENNTTNIERFGRSNADQIIRVWFVPKLRVSSPLE